MAPLTPCTDGDFEYGLHGTVSNTPVTRVSIDSVSEASGDLLAVSGRIIDAVLTRGTLILERRISSGVGTNAIKVEDTVTNDSSEPQPYMITYHLNFGYPLLSPQILLFVPMRPNPRNQGKS